MVRKTSAFAVELDQEQVSFLKKTFRLKSDHEVRGFIENRVRRTIDRARKRYERD